MRPVPLALALGALAASVAGCAEDSYLLVSVEAQPAVHDATRLRVTLGNAGTMRTDELPLDGAAFPVTFSVSAPGRTGDLAITVEAVNGEDLVVGRGTAATTIAATEARVRLDSTDFVVNTDVAEDQYPSDDFEAHGYQVAALPDGTWTVAYRGDCRGPCEMYARRFDVTGRPVTTRLAASTNGFPISTDLTSFASTPAVASAGSGTIVLWDFDEPTTTNVGVACRALDATGQGSPAQAAIATDAGTDVLAVTPLANSNFAIAWTAFLSSARVVRGAIVRPDCTVLPGGGPVSVSTTTSATRPAVAASGIPSTVMYAWISAGGVRARFASATGALTGATDLEFLPASATEVVEFVRVAPLPTGFAVVVRWALATGTEGPGRLELYRTTTAGMVVGAPVPVSSRSGTDFQSSESFGVASSPDGTLVIAWHACGANGDGNGCGVFARAFRADGTPIGDELVVATTTLGDQTNPSVTALPGDAFAVVWRDDSATPPDVSGSAVRARIIYPADATAAR